MQRSPAQRWRFLRAGPSPAYIARLYDPFKQLNICET